MVKLYDITQEEFINELRKFEERRRSDEDLFTVMGVDMFDGTDWVQGKYKTKDEAFAVAKEQRKKALGRATGPTIADQYYVYDAHGRYLGEGKT